MNGATALSLLLLAFVGLVLLWFAWMGGSAIAAWLYGVRVGARVSLPAVVAMRLRRVRVRPVMDARVIAQRAGLDLTVDALETHSLAGGNPVRVCEAMEVVVEAGLEPPPFMLMCAYDLAGRDALTLAEYVISNDGALPEAVLNRPQAPETD